MGFPSGEGGFHAKAAALERERPYFAVKLNANFSSNPKWFGLPAIQGIVLLSDATNGLPLALLDSIEITILRTGAATAVAARHLARAASSSVTICGCGNQGRVQLRALARVLPLSRANAWDSDPERAARFALELQNELSIPIEPVRDLPAALARSDVCVTCTPSREPFLWLEDLAAGTFLAAVGADSPDKQELDPRIVASVKVIADSLEQCAEIGEIHHAIRGGLLSPDRVHAELADVVVGRRPGRESEKEIIVFDSTGTALEDVAAAIVVYEKALATGVGASWEIAG